MYSPLCRWGCLGDNACVGGAINDFCKDAPQYDDITMMAVRYDGRVMATGDGRREETVSPTTCDRSPITRLFVILVIVDLVLCDYNV
jgi:hypothetical protein